MLADFGFVAFSAVGDCIVTAFIELRLGASCASTTPGSKYREVHFLVIPTTGDSSLVSGRTDCESLLSSAAGSFFFKMDCKGRFCSVTGPVLCDMAGLAERCLIGEPPKGENISLWSTIGAASVSAEASSSATGT